MRFGFKNSLPPSHTIMSSNAPETNKFTRQVQCLCGKVIEDTASPNPVGFLLISEEDLLDLEVEGQVDRESVTTIFDHVVGRGKAVLECQNCGRLIIFPDANGAARFYKREK